MEETIISALEGSPKAMTATAIARKLGVRCTADFISTLRGLARKGIIKSMRTRVSRRGLPYHVFYVRDEQLLALAEDIGIFIFFRKADVACAVSSMLGLGYWNAEVSLDSVEHGEGRLALEGSYTTAEGSKGRWRLALEVTRPCQTP